ncbi:Uncharacterised protein [Salmonella enterica subsp. enterica serovar Typhimurium str. DT104]|nr:Uncharacterised protein [Salmonella enterica subsp. enterica serovar Typhimurium str. DT104]
MDRDTNLMGVKIIAFKKTDIVCRDNRQTTCLSQLNRSMEIGLFILSAGTDQFQEVAIGKMRFIESNALLHQRLVAA